MSVRWLKWALLIVLAVTLAASDGVPRRGPVGRATGVTHYRVGVPYRIDGAWYYPKEDWSYDKTGIASWYGEQFQGRRTADGEIFNFHSLSAAHRTLPMPVVVRVTNLTNGRSLKLRVNDRGPFAATDDRIIDVSRHATRLLGFERKGIARVRVQIDVPASMKAVAASGHDAHFLSIPLPKLPPTPILIAIAAAMLGAFGFWFLAVDDDFARRANALSPRTMDPRTMELARQPPGSETDRRAAAYPPGFHAGPRLVAIAERPASSWRQIPTDRFWRPS